MNIRQIDSFIVLSEELHYRKAAERLNITQPSLSQQIKRLENDLGVALFIRHNRNIILSKAGRIFLRKALDISNDISEIRQELLYFKDSQRDVIRVGVSGSHCVLNAFQKFTDRYPDVMLCIREFTSDETVQKVIDHHLDIGIVYERPYHESLVFEPLIEDGYLAVIPQSHELATKKHLNIKDFENQQLVLLSDDFYLRKVFDAHLAKHHIVPNIICELSNNYACVDFCVAQLGISIVSESFFTSQIDGIVLKEIEDFKKREILGMVYREELNIDEPIRFLQTELKKLS